MMEIYPVDFISLERRGAPSEELMELAQELEGKVENIASTTEKGLAYYSIARLYKRSGKLSDDSDYKNRMGEKTIRFLELAVDCGHWKSIELLRAMFKNGQWLCDPNPEEYAKIEKRRKEWRKEIWNFYVDNIASLLERKGFVGYKRSHCLYAGYTKTNYGIANFILVRGRLPFKLKFNGRRKEINLDKMVDAEVVEAISERTFFGVGYDVSEAVLDRFLFNQLQNLCERWPERNQNLEKIEQVFDDVVFPYFFEWKQTELVNKIVEHRRKLGHKMD